MKWRLAWALPSKVVALLLGGGIWFNPCPIHCEVFYAQDEALKLAFPEASAIEKKIFVLSDEQTKTVEKLARASLPSKLFTFYQGLGGGKEVLGYAAIVNHTVRSQTQTLLVVLSPVGKVSSTVVLAFNEPPEYLASKRWLKQFENKDLSSKLKAGDDIAGIVGSTLTANAVAGAVRQVLALHQVLILGRESGAK